MSIQRGFTLIEILVVLVIISTVSVLAVVRFEPSSAQLVRNTAEKVAIAFENARDQAILSSTPTAISSDGKGYQLWKAGESDQEWYLLSEQDILSAEQFPDNVEVKIQKVDGEDQKMGERVIFDPSGLSEPVAWMLESESAQIWVVVDALGRVEVKDAL